MKKIIFIILLFILIPKVNASTYYSDYVVDNDYISDFITETDQIKIDLEKEVYQYYKENIRYEYLEDSSYEKTGNSKDIMTPWVDDINLIDASKPYDTEYKYYHPKTKEYQHLIFKNNGNQEKIKYIKIYDMKKNVIEFNMENITLYHGDRYIFVINNLDMAFVTLELEFENSSSEIDMEIYLSEDKDILNNGQFIDIIDTNKVYINDFTKYDISNGNEMVLEHTRFLPSNIIYYITYYRNNYKLYEYKIIDKEYIEEYGDNSNDEYLVDINKTKKLYKYKRRDKVTIKDDLNIDSKDIKLTDFIEFSSIDLNNIKITSNVNYNKNGIYEINYLLPFKTVTKEIKVNIESNYIDLINEQRNYINDLSNSTMESNYAVDKKNLEIKETILEEENKVNELTELLNTCYKEKKELLDQKEILKTEKKVKQQSFSYIYILLLLIILLITCRIKTLKKNI